MKDDHGAPIIIRADEVQAFFTDEFWAYCEIAAMSAILETAPYSGGWAEWPAEVALALAAIRAEDNLIEKERIDGR